MEFYKKAFGTEELYRIQAGLGKVGPVADQFYGDRSGYFEDPFGHQLGFATHKEDLTPDELNERARAAHGG